MASHFQAAFAICFFVPWHSIFPRELSCGGRIFLFCLFAQLIVTTTSHSSGFRFWSTATPFWGIGDASGELKLSFCAFEIGKDVPAD